VRLHDAKIIDRSSDCNNYFRIAYCIRRTVMDNGIQRNVAKGNEMLTEDSVFDPIKDAYGRRVKLNDDLLTALADAVQNDAGDWLVDAVHTAVTTDDLLYLIRQCERNTGWTRP